MRSIPISSTDNYLPAGSLEIDTCTITSINGTTYDFRTLVQEFSVYDNVQKSFIVANFVIGDAVSLVTNLPIVGQETIKLTFKTPHPAFNKSISVTLRVIAIEKFSRSNPRSSSYLLKCVSSDYVKDITTKIRKSYRQQTISQIANTVFTSYINSDANTISVSDTDGSLRTIVIPNMSPSEAMYFLAREAKSTDYPASNFTFWQSFEKYYFKTIDELIDPKTQTPLDYYYTTDFNTWSDSLSAVDVASSGPGGVDRSGQFSGKPFEFLKMISFEFSRLEQYDSITRMGSLESKMRILDPAMSLYNIKSYDYFTDYDKFKRTSSNAPQKFLVQGKTDYIVSQDSATFIQLSNKAQQNNYGSDQKEDFIQYNIASRGMLENIAVTVTIPGDSTRRAGDLVNLQFPQYSGLSQDLNKVNKFVSGKYLVLSTRHAYTAQGYKTAMNCVKNAFEEGIT